MNMKIIILLIAVFFAVMCVAGCSTVHYIESETPPGQVPEPPYATAAPITTLSQKSSYAPSSQTQVGSEFISEFSAIRSKSGNDKYTIDFSTETMARFKVAYST